MVIEIYLYNHPVTLLLIHILSIFMEKAGRKRPVRAPEPEKQIEICPMGEKEAKSQIRFYGTESVFRAGHYLKPLFKFTHLFSPQSDIRSQHTGCRK